jgi:hypothetical protein
LPVGFWPAPKLIKRQIVAQFPAAFDVHIRASLLGSQCPREGGIGEYEQLLICREIVQLKYYFISTRTALIRH